MNSAKGGWLVFNKRDCFHWLLCAQYLHLPPELVYHIAKHMFYNFEPNRTLLLCSFTCLQSRVVGSVLEKQCPITIWNALPFYGKSVCARKIAYHANIYT